MDEQEEKRMKMAIIAGASHALKFKEQKWKATEEEVIQHVTSKVQDILDKIDKEL